MTAFTPKSAKPDNVTDRGKVERIKLSGAGDSTEETEWIDVATQAELDAHASDTTSVHGIADTSVLATATSVSTAVSNHAAATDPHGDRAYADGLASNYEAAGAVSTHSADTTSVHGIADTSALVTLTGSETLTNKTLTTPVLTLEQGASVAPTAEGRIAWDTDDNWLKVGDGAAARSFPDSKFTDGLSGSAILSTLPQFVAAVTSYDDFAATTLSIVSVGSSVGAGSTLASPSTDAPSAYLATALNAVVNKLGNITFEHVNGCVGGHAFADGEADYATAAATATGTVKLVPVVFGMNDGNTDLYHNGQTYPGVRTFIRQLVADVVADEADPIVFTTPHPHTGRQTWTASLGNAYPSGGRVPADNTGASIVNITTSSGATVPASYRHLRVNEMIRRACAELGACVIDAERYWFEAVAKHGEDALFDVGEIVHPNLLGHQLSYHAAIDQFVQAFDAARLVTTAPPPANITTDEQFNVFIANPLSIRTLKDKEYGLLLVRARHSGFGGSHAAHAFLVLGESAGSGGRVLDLGGIQGGGSNDLVTVSIASGGVVTLTAVIDGTDIAWTYTRGFPL